MKHNITHRNEWVVLLLLVVTLGLYSVYWLYETIRELHEIYEDVPHPGTVFLIFIPLFGYFYLFYLFWKISDGIEDLVGFDKVGMFLILLFGNFIGIIVAQVQLNKFGIDPKKEKLFPKNKFFLALGIVQIFFATYYAYLQIYFLVMVPLTIMFSFFIFVYLIYMIAGIVMGVNLLKRKIWSLKGQLYLGIFGVVYLFIHNLILRYSFHFIPHHFNMLLYSIFLIIFFGIYLIKKK